MIDTTAKVILREENNGGCPGFWVTGPFQSSFLLMPHNWTDPNKNADDQIQYLINLAMIRAEELLNGTEIDEENFEIHLTPKTAIAIGKSYEWSQYIQGAPDALRPPPSPSPNEAFGLNRYLWGLLVRIDGVQYEDAQ